MAATPDIQGKTTATFKAGYLTDPQDDKNPDPVLRGPHQFLLDEQTFFSSSTAGTPAIESQQDAHPRRRVFGRPQLAEAADWEVAKEGINFADVPNFESYTPAYNRVGRRSTRTGTKWQTTPV